jgi:hypothetical protein
MDPEVSFNNKITKSKIGRCGAVNTAGKVKDDSGERMKT